MVSRFRASRSSIPDIFGPIALTFSGRSAPARSTRVSLHSVSCCAALAAGEAQTAAGPLPTRDATLAALACALLPLAEPGCEALDRKRRPTPLPQAVCKEGLKLPGRTATDARRVCLLRPY